MFYEACNCFMWVNKNNELWGLRKQRVAPAGPKIARPRISSLLPQNGKIKPRLTGGIWGRGRDCCDADAKPGRPAGRRPQAGPSLGGGSTTGPPGPTGRGSAAPPGGTARLRPNAATRGPGFGPRSGPGQARPRPSALRGRVRERENLTV